MGVKAISSGIENAPLVSLISLNSKEASLLLLIGDRRAARLIRSQEIESSERLSFKTNLIKVLKKNPWTVVTLQKVSRNKDERNPISVTTLDSSFAVNIDALTPNSPNSELRENLDKLGKSLVLGFNDFGSVIDENTLVEEPSVQKVKKVSAKPDKAETQLSLFDLFERNKK